MKYTPHHYQAYAAEKIIEEPAFGLFLDCGMGKTVVTLTAVLDLLHDYFDVVRVLVIAPLRVAEDTWSKECEKWQHLKHLRISKILGSEQQRSKAVNTPADIYIINRENVEWLVTFHGKNWPYDMVILDELSSFKSVSAKRFRALKRVRPLIKRVVGLTGTPAPNGLLDLWPQLYLLDRGERLGKTLTGYREQYFVPDKRNQNVVFSYKTKKGSEDSIYEKISDICISMKACDYLIMPERIDNVVEVQLPEKEAALYKRMEKDMLLPFESGDIDAVNAAALSNKLLQMANGAVYDENSAVKIIHNKKLEALEDLIEAANGKPVLIFYSFLHDKDRISERLSVTELKTSEDISKWNAGKIPIAIAHPASAGHGLNLQAGGSTLIWFGLTWSLELYQQANARLWRQGQKETVIIHHLVAAGTIDEQVMAALNQKEIGQASLMNAIKARIGAVENERQGIFISGFSA